MYFVETELSYLYKIHLKMIPKDYWASCIFVASDTPFSLNASMVNNKLVGGQTL